MTDRNPVEDALRNSLILNRVFSSLPTKFLLNCSLVNKAWCEESRKFIREHRKCTARILHKCKATLPFIRNLFKFNSQILGMKTTVPYNGIHFITASSAWCDESGTEHTELCRIIRSDDVDMKTKLKFKYLCIELIDHCENCHYGRHCSEYCREYHCRNHYGAMTNLLQSMSDKIEYLRIVQPKLPSPSYSSNFRECSSSSSLGVFTKLETLEINSEFLRCNEQLLMKLIYSAPNLRKVVNCQQDEYSGIMPMIEMLSPDKLYLLANLDVEILWEEHAEIYKKIAHAGPALESLSVSVPFGENFSTFGDSFRRICQELLESSQRSLKTMKICGKISQSSILFHLEPAVVLINLSELSFDFHYGTQRQFSNFFGGGIDFGRFSPSLEKIKLIYWEYPPHVIYNNQNDQQIRVPFLSSSSVTKLELESNCYRSSSLTHLARTFPAVTSLQIKSLDVENVINFSQIASLWPALETIQLDGMTAGLCLNYDSEFCGTTPEEMACLWGQSPEFLSQVHIVPIRPALSSLTSK